MGLRTGAFDKRITIEEKTSTRSGTGGEVVTWTPIDEVWARVEPIRGNEFFAAGQMQDATDHRVTIRYRSGITREQRVVWRGEPMDIVSVIDVNGRGENLELMCISGVRNGR